MKIPPKTSGRGWGYPVESKLGALVMQRRHCRWSNENGVNRKSHLFSRREFYRKRLDAFLFRLENRPATFSPPFFFFFFLRHGMKLSSTRSTEQCCLCVTSTSHYGYTLISAVDFRHCCLLYRLRVTVWIPWSCRTLSQTALTHVTQEILVSCQFTR